ncbi:hypothetical protein HY990_02985 [Candidatus Micrarchaeota archaeon]|nr:hypothetical protein [Candidatus Micrarchaeota archaeon]
MKESSVKIDDHENFEEVTGDEKPTDTSGQNAQFGSGNKPDFRVVQADRDKNGNVIYLSVGGMWKNVSKNGNDFYTLKIGNLKLLVFPNNK